MTYISTKIPVKLVSNTTSTMNDINEMWRNHAPLYVSAALEQSAGRGRYGHTWTAPPGCCLMLTYPYQSNSNCGDKYAFTAALAVHDFIKQFSKLSCTFLWPNDVVVGTKKLAGILIEQPLPKCFSIGIGINIKHMEWPDDIASRAISIEDLTDIPDTGMFSLCQQLVCLLEARLSWAESVSLKQVILAWKVFSSTTGTKYHGIDSKVVTAVDVDDEGRLLVDDDHKIIAVTSAEPLHKDCNTIK